ncbi:hypothetical protein TMEN_4479 [Trichophyton mentagrophytes]|nr:hypothetical protein TMEN_4479 [Trichophyton mentagrophytes]
MRSPTPIFTSDTLHTYKLLVSMRPQPPNVLSASDHHRCDQDDTLSTASETPTLVGDTVHIRMLLAYQPFDFYDDPSDPQDIAVIRSTSFRNFLEEKGNYKGVTASIPVITVTDESLDIDEETQKSYGRSLIASSLMREGQIALDNKKQTTSNGKLYRCQLERAYMVREDISRKMEANGYRLDFTVFTKDGDFKIQEYLSEAEIHQPERRGIHLYASQLRARTGGGSAEQALIPLGILKTLIPGALPITSSSPSPMCPESLPISPSDGIYGRSILALRAILSANEISPEDILKELPDGTDKVLNAVVWQVDSNPLLNDPPRKLVGLMKSVAKAKESEMESDIELKGYLNDAWVTWKSISKGEAKEVGERGEKREGFFSKLKNIIETAKELSSLIRERQEFHSIVEELEPGHKRNLEKVDKDISEILAGRVGRAPPRENETEVPDDTSRETEQASLQRKRPGPRPDSESDEKRLKNTSGS